MVEKLSGTDQGVYANWLTFGSGSVDGTVTRGGLPFTGDFKVEVTDLDSGAVFTEPPAGSFSGDNFSLVLPVGSYELRVLPESPLLASQTVAIVVACKSHAALNFAVPNRPPEAAAEDVTINEGEDLTLDGSGSNDPDGDPIDGSWDFGGDNYPGLTANLPSAGTPIIQDDLAGEPATLTVTDIPLGASDDTTITVTVLNVDPDIGSVAAPGMALLDETVNLNGTFTDAGVLDTHELTVDWGDGAETDAAVTQGAGSGTFSDSHEYDVPRRYTVTVTIVDDDGGTDFVTLTILIKAPGKMTGGGRVDTGEQEPAKGKGKPKAVHTTHGFELFSNEDGSFGGNLQYNDHRSGDVFHATGFEHIFFIDDPALDPGKPAARFDTAFVSGVGRLNGVDGVIFKAIIIDDGEPDKTDTFKIEFPGGDSLGIEGPLVQGNHQAHDPDE